MKFFVFSMTIVCAGCSGFSTPHQSVERPASVEKMAGSRGSDVTRITDPEFGVVCYVSDGYKAGGISCLRLGPMERTP